MASEKDFGIKRSPTQNPRKSPVRETEPQRRECYIQTKFREDIRHIKSYLHTDITKFRLGNPIIKEFMWNFQTTFNTAHLQSVSYFLTTLGFREKVDENMPNLTVFRFPLPIEEHSIHVKITEQTSRIIIHAHLDRKIHTEFKYNDFTTYLLSELEKFLRNIYRPSFMNRQMRITPQPLSESELQEIQEEQMYTEITSETKFSLIKKIKFQFTQYISEIKAQSFAESKSQKRFISSRRMFEIAFSLITSNINQEDNHLLEQIEFNIKLFLFGEINIIYPELRESYEESIRPKEPKGSSPRFFSEIPVKDKTIIEETTLSPLSENSDRLQRTNPPEKVSKEKQGTISNTRYGESIRKAPFVRDGKKEEKIDSEITKRDQRINFWKHEVLSKFAELLNEDYEEARMNNRYAININNVRNNVRDYFRKTIKSESTEEQAHFKKALEILDSKQVQSHFNKARKYLEIVVNEQVETENREKAEFNTFFKEFLKRKFEECYNKAYMEDRYDLDIKNVRSQIITSLEKEIIEEEFQFVDNYINNAKKHLWSKDFERAFRDLRKKLKTNIEKSRYKAQREKEENRKYKLNSSSWVLGFILGFSLLVFGILAIIIYLPK